LPFAFLLLTYFRLRLVEGGAFTLADYKDKIVVLNLWATWCPPCRKETPHIIDIQKEYGGRGVAVVGLTTENPATDGQKVRDFVRDFGVNYKIGYARADLALELMRGNTSIPQTFVIVPGGRVVAHYRGYSPQLPDMLRAALDKAQSEVSQK
jgi:thiol-disulfide isomerase/thioredoxin